MARRPGPHSPIRDQALLDALEDLPQTAYAGTVWRSVREGRDPLECARGGGRWDDGTFDVLYTSETRQTALAERRFHLFQGQPIPPSRVRYVLFELSVSLQAVVTLDQRASLSGLGLDIARFGALAYAEKHQEYPRSQDIAEACWFLGADGLLVPSARDSGGRNLVVFCDQDTEKDLTEVRNHGPAEFTV